MPSLPQRAYYVYVLLRPNGSPFYVGKGKGRRIKVHTLDAQRGHVCLKCNIIRKLWRAGADFTYSIVFSTDDEQEAFDYERRLIAAIGREYLANQTDGGEGTSNPTDDTRNKRRAALTGRPVTAETRQKLSESNRGNQSARGAVRSAETRRKMSEAQKGNTHARGASRSPELRQRMSETRRGEKRSDAMREKMRIINTGKKLSEEHRKKISEGLKNSARYKNKKP